MECLSIAYSMNLLITQKWAFLIKVEHFMCKVNLSFIEVESIKGKVERIARNIEDFKEYVET